MKVAGHFEEPFFAADGIGQGDPKSLFVALLYITVQFRLLDKEHPEVDKGAVVDDRNLRGKPEQMTRALECTFQFDKGAGHLTNPKNGD